MTYRLPYVRTYAVATSEASEPPTATTCTPGTRHGLVGPEGCYLTRPIRYTPTLAQRSRITHILFRLFRNSLA